MAGRVRRGDGEWPDRAFALRLLLDTHVLLWWLDLNPKLADHTRALIDDPKNEAMVSIVSFWEIAVKVRVGKLKADIAAIASIVEGQRLTRLPVEDAHLQTLLRLPRHHGDPFDHLLIAQAIAEGAGFVTGDRAAARYPVKVIPAG
jgi:PIN domain nuclease of toxin-antitoxin system